MKTKRIILVVAFTVAMLGMVLPGARAASVGWERYTNWRTAVYFQYFPVVAYDSAYPTASELYPIKFDVTQYDPWQYFFFHHIPWGFVMDIYIWDCWGDGVNYLTFYRWLPTFDSQHGTGISFTLGPPTGPLSISYNLAGASTDYYYNYDQYYAAYNGVPYKHLAHLEAWYHGPLGSGPPVGGVSQTVGAGIIGVQNGLAQAHKDHHILIWMQVTLYWKIWGTTSTDSFNYVFGDDIPSDGDCWLTVQPGSVSYSGF